MAKNTNKRHTQHTQDTLSLKKLSGLLALCEFLLIPFFFVSPPFLTKESGVPVGSEEAQIAAVHPVGEGAVQPLPVSKPKAVMTVTVTAYSSTEDQTDQTPFHTANGREVQDGIVAANFLSLGTSLRIPDVFGDKVFTVEDRMHERFDRRLDIWMPTREAARAFGIRNLTIEIL